MRIAVVGSGISGLGAAWLLARRHDVTLFEAEGRLGGHAHTHSVDDAGRPVNVDTGFIVYNPRTYPNFVRLLAALGVAGQPSDMSFGVRCRRCALEYSSRGLRGLFAQRRRLADPGHLRMLRDIPRFHRHGRAFLAGGADPDTSLGAFLERGGYSRGFLRHHLLPMAGAVWSAPFEDILDFPAASFLRFFANHGWLSVSGAPRWWTVRGGSRSYVERIEQGLGPRVRKGARVAAVRRLPAGVELTVADAPGERFDAVVLATHADDALRLLADPAAEEATALSRFRYSRNRTLLHTDRAALPDSSDAWASWNCDIRDCRDDLAPVSLTYHLNRLQGLESRQEYCVTLNGETPRRTLATMDYAHPVLDREAFRGQAEIRALNGRRSTWFCGAHLRYGFHEDGLVSAIDVAERLGVAF